MYRLMLLDRRFNEHVLRWYDEGRISQGMHPNVGQEAIGVGACYGLRPQDWVVPSLRTSNAFWVRGVSLLQQLNAMFANADSISRGKDTAHHAAYVEHGILPGTAIVGGSIPVAVGAALALRMQGTENVVLDFFGDGASNRGDFHEALNMAALYRAPVVFVCENNSYGQTVAARYAMAITDIADRAIGYGMPGVVVDGQDVLAVFEATQEAVERARNGGGPTLLECKTCRFLPHYPIFEEDRTPEELAEWTKRDPLTLLGAILEQKGTLDATAIAEMDAAIHQDLDEAIRQAEKVPPPGPDEVYRDVYAEAVQEMGI
jgi:TPP-dependent pyruvate/acetoin dehydrogenase alpha subunit